MSVYLCIEVSGNVLEGLPKDTLFHVIPLVVDDCVGEYCLTYQSKYPNLLCVFD